MELAGDRAEAARGYRACIEANPHAELAVRSRQRLALLRAAALIPLPTAAPFGYNDFQEALLICPNCRQYTPDQGFRCMHCDAILKKKEAYPGKEMASRQRRGDGSGFKPWMLLPLVLLAVLAYLFSRSGTRPRPSTPMLPEWNWTSRTICRKGKPTSSIFTATIARPAGRSRRCCRKLDRKRPGPGDAAGRHQPQGGQGHRLVFSPGPAV